MSLRRYSSPPFFNSSASMASTVTTTGFEASGAYTLPSSDLPPRARVARALPSLSSTDAAGLSRPNFFRSAGLALSATIDFMARTVELAQALAS